MSLRIFLEEVQTELFNKNGAFFAFGTDQFNEQKKEGIKYVSMGAGLICPKDNVKELSEGLNTTYQAAVKKDIETNGKDKIIRRELYNFECFYKGDPNDAIDALKDYNFTDEEIWAAYKKEYVNADL